MAHDATVVVLALLVVTLLVVLFDTALLLRLLDRPQERRQRPPDWDEWSRNLLRPYESVPEEFATTRRVRRDGRKP